MKTTFNFFSYLLLCSFLFLGSCSNETLDEQELATDFSDVTTPNLESRVANNLRRINVIIRQGENIETALLRTIRNNGANRIYVLPAGTFTINRPIILPRNVDNIGIFGSSFQNNRRTTIRTTLAAMRATNHGSRSGVFVCQSNNTDFRNFTINGGHDFRIAGASYACVNIFGGRNMNAENMRFENATYGFCNPSNGLFAFQGTGLPIHGLRVVNCQFNNIGRGVIYNRLWSRRRFNQQVGNVRSMQRITIQGNRFTGRITAAVTLDCGNDGTDGNNTNRNLPGAAIARTVVTNFNNSLIQGNTIAQAQRYNVALAKVSSVTINNNNFGGNTVLDFEGNLNTFQRSVNLEHEVNNVRITNNRFNAPVRPNNQTRNLNHRHIFSVTFTDYGNPQLFENGVRNVTITGNIFNGSVETAILGAETTNFTISGNRFNRRGLTWDVFLRRAIGPNSRARGTINPTIASNRDNNNRIINLRTRIELRNNVNQVNN